MSYIKIENKLNNFINDYRNKYKNEFIYLWTILLLSYYHDKYKKIIYNFEYINKLSKNNLKILEKLVKNNDIFYEEFIINFFYNINNKNVKFNIHEHIINNMMLISSNNENTIHLAYFIFYLNYNFNKSNKIKAMQDFLELNNIISNYLQD